MPDTDTPATPGPEEDVVDLLLAQHAQIEQLFLLVVGGTGDTRRDAFDDLVKLLAAHETAEEEVIHPLARTLPGGGGDAMVDTRSATSFLSFASTFRSAGCAASPRPYGWRRRPRPRDRIPAPSPRRATWPPGRCWRSSTGYATRCASLRRADRNQPSRDLSTGSPASCGRPCRRAANSQGDTHPWVLPSARATRVAATSCTFRLVS